MYTFRFAPAPSGLLHVGNTFIAHVNDVFSDFYKGRHILRIDDTNKLSSNENYKKCLKEDLQWLNIIYDEEYKQSERNDIYEKYFMLLQKNGFVYPCYDDKKDLINIRNEKRKKGLPPIYNKADSTRNSKKDSNPISWRFNLSRKTISWKEFGKTISLNTSSLSDPIIKSSDNRFLYIFTSIVDDIDLCVTHIIRGEDHRTNTSVHIEICKALCHETQNFLHLPLLTDTTGAPLSKRSNSTSINYFRKKNFDPEPLKESIASRKKILSFLSQEGEKSVHSFFQPFQIKHLESLQERYIKHLSFEEIYKKMYSLYEIKIKKQEWNCIKNNIKTYESIYNWCLIFREGPKLERKKIIEYAHVVQIFYEKYSNDNPMSILEDISNKTNLPKKDIMRIIRYTLTGIKNGPSLQEIFLCIGHEQIRKRLNEALLFHNDYGSQCTKSDCNEEEKYHG